MLVCGSGVGACGRGVQAGRYPRRDLPRHLQRAPGRRARRHERALPRLRGRRAVARARARRCVSRRDLRRRRALRRAPPEGRANGKGDEGWPSHGLHELAARGQSVWFDTLSRDLVQSGELAADDGRRCRRRRHVQPDDLPEGALDRRRVRRRPEGAARRRPTTRRRSSSRSPCRTSATRATCSGPRTTLRTASTATSRWRSSRESRTTPTATFEQAQWISKEVDRPNLYVKIPATEPGLPAIEDSIAHGISINITLIFSLDRYKAVVEAYLRGLERLIARRRRSVDGRLGRVVLRLARRHARQTSASRPPAIPSSPAGSRSRTRSSPTSTTWRRSRGRAGTTSRARARTKQRCLWASTSTKNPAYRDVMYVEELIGPETVNTMPLETIEAFQDHGEVRGDTVLEGLDEARALLEQLAAAGVDYDDVTDTLEAEGVQKFVDSFDADRRECRRKARARWRRHDDAEIVERIWARDASLWTGADEAKWLGWLDEPVAHARGRRSAAAVRRLGRRRDRRRRAARHGRLVARTRGASSRRSVPRRFHVLDTTHPQAIRDARSTARPRRARCSSRRRSPGRRSRRARTPTTSGSGAPAARTGSRSQIPAPRSRTWRRQRGFRAIFAGEPTIGGPLLGAVGVRDGPGRADGRRSSRACSSGQPRWPTRAGCAEGNPGLELGAVTRRRLARRTRQDLRRAESPAASASGPSSCSPSRPGSWARG